MEGKFSNREFSHIRDQRMSVFSAPPISSHNGLSSAQKSLAANGISCMEEVTYYATTSHKGNTERLFETSL
jgi:hypothetical protein